MVAPVNDIDVHLQAEPLRTLAPRGGIILNTSANVVKVAGGVGAPSVITIAATPIALAGTVQFTTQPNVPLTIDSTGLIATLKYSDMGSSSIVVYATLTTGDGITYNASTTISQVTDGGTGASAAYVVLTNNGQVFSRANAAAAFAPTSLMLTAVPYGGPATYQWQALIGGTWTDIAGAASASLTVNSGDFAGAQTYRVKATINGAVYIDQETLVQVTGGTNAITGFLDNESVTLAADNAGGVSSFAPANGTFHVFDGTTDKTGDAAVAYSAPAGSQVGCAVSIAATGAITVSAMPANTATATLQAVYGGVTIQKVLSLAKAVAGPQGQSGIGQTGARGPGHYYASGSSWTDAAANAACPGGAPVVNDVVTISNNTTFVMEKIWSGSAWNTQGTVINGNLLVSGSVTSAALNVGSLSAVSATIGTLRTATTGGRVEISDNVIKVFDSNVLRVKLGNLSL